MRLSWPMPRRTSLMSAPARSQRFAISLMKLIFVESMALATYLVISALSGDMRQKRLVGPQVGLIEVRQHVDRPPAPGADHHAVGLHEVVDRHAFLEKLGIAGHVDLAAGQLLEPRGQPWRWCPPARCSCRPRSRPAPGAGRARSTTAQRAERSAEPSSAGGVPTARKTSRAVFAAAARSVVKCSRPPATLRATSSARPGS